jgi:hypothetical protein
MSSSYMLNVMFNGLMRYNSLIEAFCYKKKLYDVIINHNYILVSVVVWFRNRFRLSFALDNLLILFLIDFCFKFTWFWSIWFWNFDLLNPMHFDVLCKFWIIWLSLYALFHDWNFYFCYESFTMMISHKF